MRIPVMTAVALGLTLNAGAVVAGPDEIQQSLSKVFPGKSADAISESVVDGLYEVLYGGQVFYITADGEYLMHGNLIELDTMNNLTRDRLNGVRTQALAQIPDEDTILFRAEDEKHTVTVFTDIDCGYCRKLHNEMEAINDEGISVRYLFFPRSGPNTKSWSKAVSVWCAEDRQAALTAAKNGADPETRSCANPVAEHYQLVQELNLSGTPAIVLENGRLIPGYVEAAKLAKLADEAAAN